MRPVIHLASLLGIFTLALVGLTGCGEKRMSVATVSGAPGEETSSSTSSANNNSGLSGASLDESSHPGQHSSLEKDFAEAVQAVPPIEPEPLNFAHEPSIPSQPDESSMKEPLAPPLTGSHSEMDSDSTFNSDSAFIGDAGSSAPLIIGDLGSSSAPLIGDLVASAPLTNGTDFSTQQSSSSSMIDPPQDHAEVAPFTFPGKFQDDQSSPQNEIEPIPEKFQVAKTEPSDILRQQLEKMREEELATVSTGLEDVFFQFDSWSLTEEAKESLERDLNWLQNDPTARLVIEGHADQRGTQAYNMVLGKKRAMAIREYLVQSGVAPSRLSVISYGKDKPFCQDPTEVCYQLNRRGHLLVRN